MAILYVRGINSEVIAYLKKLAKKKKVNISVILNKFFSKKCA